MSALTVWHLFILAVILLILVTLVPGAFLLWLGVAAGVTGAAVWLAPGLNVEMQMLLFSVTAVASIIGWTAYRRHHPAMSEQPSLNRRGSQYVGRVFTLDEPLVNGRGRLRVDDTVWRITSAELPAGTRVSVVAVDGTALTVRPTPDNQ